MLNTYQIHDFERRILQPYCDSEGGLSQPKILILLEESVEEAHVWTCQAYLAYASPRSTLTTTHLFLMPSLDSFTLVYSHRKSSSLLLSEVPHSRSQRLDNTKGCLLSWK